MCSASSNVPGLLLCSVDTEGLHHQHLFSLFNLTPICSTALQVYNFFIVNMYKGSELSGHAVIRQWSGTCQPVISCLALDR